MQCKFMHTNSEACLGDREDSVLVKLLRRFTACKQEDGQMDGWISGKNEKIRKREKNGRTNMMDAQTGEGRRQRSGWCSKR